MELTTAVILCGGQGTRLRPILGNVPKCLAPVAGKPFVSYILDHLANQGVKVCLFCTTPAIGDQLDTIFGMDYKGIELGYWEDDAPQGTGSDLGKMAILLSHEKYSDPVLVVNGDSWSNFRLPTLHEYSQIPNFNALVVRTFQGGQFVNSGVYLLSKDLLRSIPCSEATGEGGIGLDNWIEGYRKCRPDNNGVCYCVTSKPFIDMGTPEGYAGVENFLRQQGALNG